MKKYSDSHEVTFALKKASPGQLEILRRLLIARGAKPESVVESSFSGSERLTVYFTDAERARKFRGKVLPLGLKNVRISQKTVKARDWQTVWKQEYKPFALTPRFEVVPYGYRKTHRSRGHEPVYIDTSYAFGTGLHATTRFMASFVERCAGRYESFLDIGTGTGILAILALKCGAREVTAIDLRRDIVEIANMNFKENGYPVQRARAVDFQKFRTSRRYDFVAANLVTLDLIAFRKSLVRLVRKGGYLAVSGISLALYPELRAAFDGLPIRCLKVEKGEGWHALLFRRNV
ncbi:MAG: 50S ribosomal protein L11 methyltransferase [Candidatus Omnitrophica bacterium]|nr:50S ribosomal protein L11 methyltransferase [Candidatus Omnitrophota bacterium]